MTTKDRYACRGGTPTLKVYIGEIEQEHFKFPAIVCIDDAGAGVDEVLRRKTAPGRYSAV